MVDGNWQGEPVGYDATWGNTGAGAFSRAWGKNVGSLANKVGCSYDGLSTSRADGSEACTVIQIRRGTNPLGGSFTLDLDSRSPTAQMSDRALRTSAPIAHNAFASAADTNGDGTSMEEILEAMPNIGDVTVTRTPVNLGGNSGGFSWLVTFLRDSDSPCEEKDGVTGLCNSPGNVPKLSGADTTYLLGTRMATAEAGLERWEGEVTFLDASDEAATPRGVAEIQEFRTFDLAYRASDGFENNATFTLSFNGTESECLPWNVSAQKVQEFLRSTAATGKRRNESWAHNVYVTRSNPPTSDEALWGSDATAAPNGYVWTIYFAYDGDVPDPLDPAATNSTTVGDGGGRRAAQGLVLDATRNSSQCRPFEHFQRLDASTLVQGAAHPVSCKKYGCVDGVALRGNFSDFYVGGDRNDTTVYERPRLVWNAAAQDVKFEVERRSNHSRTVEVSRKVIGKYGAMEWVVTFTSNPHSVPTGAGDVNSLVVQQESWPPGSRASHPIVTETVKGSTPLEGYFTVDFADPLQLPRRVRYIETAERLERKLEEMGTIHDVSVLRREWPSNETGGWGENAVADGTRGGFYWQVRFLRNPGTYGGATFPPSSGDMFGIATVNTELKGTGAQVVTRTKQDGSGHLDGGTLHLIFDGQTTDMSGDTIIGSLSNSNSDSVQNEGDSIAFNLDATSVESALEGLSNIGNATVTKRLAISHRIEGVHAVFPRDASFGYLAGVTDLSTIVAPGEVLRFGGVGTDDANSKQGTNGEELAAVALLGFSEEDEPALVTAAVAAGSPVVATAADFASTLAAGREVRLGADAYRVTKNGAEVQQLTVGAPASAHALFRFPDHTDVPTPNPSEIPTLIPTPVPTLVPTPLPTYRPTPLPTLIPTPVPTLIPTPVPTLIPSPVPTLIPTPLPTLIPTPLPTSIPSPLPTLIPSPVPTLIPTPVPTLIPTPVPTLIPSPLPTLIPSLMPTKNVTSSSRRRLRATTGSYEHEPATSFQQHRRELLTTPSPTSQPDGLFYRLRIPAYNGVANATTATCLDFYASAADVKAAIESLPNVGPGSVAVTRRGTGVFGDSFIYRIYFEGNNVRGDVPQLEVRMKDGIVLLECATNLLIVCLNDQQGCGPAVGRRSRGLRRYARRVQRSGVRSNPGAGRAHGAPAARAERGRGKHRGGLLQGILYGFGHECHGHDALHRVGRRRSDIGGGARRAATPLASEPVIALRGLRYAHPAYGEHHGPRGVRFVGSLSNPGHHRWRHFRRRRVAH